MSSRIIREYLAPKFRNNDYYGGLSDAEGALVKLVDGEPLPAPMADDKRETGDGGAGFGALVVGLVIGTLALATRIKPAFLRQAGAALVAGGILYFMAGLGLGVAVAAFIAFIMSGSLGGGGGRFGSGRGSWGSFPGGGGSWGGGGGGWSGGGGSFGGGGASGGW